MNKTEPKISLGQIKLIPNNGTLLAIPAEAAIGDESTTPVDVPQIATSLVSWALGLTVIAQQRAERCAALLLMLDLDAGQWSLCVPKQTCGTDAACWSTDRRDYPDLPASMRIGGTFQSRAGLTDEELADAVPPICGVHFIQQTEGHDHEIHCFVRTADGRVDLVGPQQVSYDDWEAALYADPQRVKFV